MRVKVQQAMQKLGYVPNAAGRALARLEGLRATLKTVGLQRPPEWVSLQALNIAGGRCFVRGPAHGHIGTAGALNLRH